MNDVKERQKLLREIASQRTPVFLSGDGLDITFETRIIDVKEGSLVLTNNVPPRYVSRLFASKQVHLQCRHIRFHANQLATDGLHLIFSTTEKIDLEETRQSERFPFSEDEKVRCVILNPFDKETLLNRSVIDMSATGLSLRTTFESKVFDPGTFLPKIKVMIDNEPYTQSAAEVVYRRKLLDMKGKLRLQVGIKFETVGNESLGGN